MARKPNLESDFDLELEDLPPEMRWREWKGRVEAVIFASTAPVTREVLARVVGKSCNLNLLIDDIRDELRGRPYELVAVADGWRLQTRKQHAEAIRTAMGIAENAKALTKAEAGVLMAVAYFQPVTRGEISEMFGREISRDLIASLRAAGMVAAGPRSPQPGAPYAYVTTPRFLSQFGFESLRDLPDLERLHDPGLLEEGSSIGEDQSSNANVDDAAMLPSDLAHSFNIPIEEEPEEDAA
jgi:segregation and condensation protein B